MTFPMHASRFLRNFKMPLFLLAALAGISGCGSDESPAGWVSPPGWVEISDGGQHARSAASTYIENAGTTSCAECHGTDLSGGTAGVSCFGNSAGCHHGPVAGWVASAPAVQVHGDSAKRAPGGLGFASCQICHAADFSGGGARIACSGCHGAAAPHPESPWRGSAYTHIDTNGVNTPVCARCHFAGSADNPAGYPASPAASGTAPGCFNSTLCHGPADAPHALGSGWRYPGEQFHGLTAKRDLSYCQGCHGTPGTTLFDGGSSPTSCQTSGCHPEARAHPALWRQAPEPFPAYSASHRDSGNRNVACAVCHRTDAAGAGPDPNAPSCYSGAFGGFSCHSDGPVMTDHDVPYLSAGHTSVTASGFSANCGTCHNETGATKNGPSCTVCHQAGSPLTSLSCTSCHSDPPVGTTYPNSAGKHGVHFALPGVTACDTCHDGLGSGTLPHYNRANARPGADALRAPPGDVAFLATYDAKSGSASFDADARTCTNVSCHGGQATPDWQTATANAIDVVNACTSCHVPGTTQYNGYFSGRHELHIALFGRSSTTCKRCHDETKVNVAGHFGALATPSFEQAPASTILPSVNYNGISCSPEWGSLTGCHGREKWE